MRVPRSLHTSLQTRQGPTDPNMGGVAPLRVGQELNKSFIVCRGGTSSFSTEINKRGNSIGVSNKSESFRFIILF